MSTITTSDGARIFYKDWGAGLPVVFSDARPPTADAWDPQMVFLANGDLASSPTNRRGHGPSEQTWDGTDTNTYADDLAELLEQLDLREPILVGHSTLPTSHVPMQSRPKDLAAVILAAAEKR